MRKLFLFPATPFLTLSAILFIVPAAGQSVTPQVIASGGGHLTGSGGSLSVTIGETAVGSFRSASGSLAQGFQPTIGSSTPLPLDFLSFTANLVGGKSILQWTTAHETNTNYFEVQRSSDGADFTKIASLPAKGHSDAVAETTYQAIDSLPLPGTDYYRIREVDLGGQVAYSPIATVKISEGVSCMVYPNPAVGEIYIRISNNNATQATIMVIDLRGRLMIAKAIQLVTGQNQVSVNLADYPRGLYTIKILGLEGLPVFKVLKE